MANLTTRMPVEFRSLREEDVPAFSRMLFDSFNAWHRRHGGDRDRFICRPEDLAIYYHIYNDLAPGCSIAAFEPDGGRLVGACFYHPREFHVALGIMSVHAECGGRGIGRALTERILGFTRDHGFPACRLVGSAGNMDSFSLYNRAGFVPRALYHDMVIDVPENFVVPPSGGIPSAHPMTTDFCVREAAAGDVDAMGILELEVSGIRRCADYLYAIENPRGVLHAAVCENGGDLEGFMISILHPALNMLGPCVARTEEAALALIGAELARFAGDKVLFLVPADKPKMVRQCYAWGARNKEMHLHQVWGEFRDVSGVNMPSFLPETG